MGDGNQELYLVFQPGDEAYDFLGIDKIGSISGESLFIHFVDDQHMLDWRSSDRSIEFTATDYEFHAWEGVFNLNSDEEELEEDDQYQYAIRDFGATPPSTDDYEDAVHDLDADTAAVNNYDPAETADFIEYSMVNMGVGGGNAATLANRIATAGAGSHSLDITLA